MKIGMCAGFKDFEKIALAKKAGFDYIETSFNAYAVASKEDRDAFLACLKANDIRCEAMNGFISLKVVGPDFDEKAVKEYIDNAFVTCGETGFEVVVFGSGAARKIPEGFDYDEAKKQIAYICREFIKPNCEKYGKRVAFENLNENETNIFNTDAEINEFVNELGIDCIKALSDNYHMALVGEPYEVVATLGQNLIHAHIANPDGRFYPQPTDAHDYKPFFEAMKKAGYDARVSVEASVPKGVDAELATNLAAKYLRELIANA